MGSVLERFQNKGLDVKISLFSKDDQHLASRNLKGRFHQVIG